MLKTVDCGFRRSGLLELPGYLDFNSTAENLVSACPS
jgi:hypothetical protein